MSAALRAIALGVLIVAVPRLDFTVRLPRFFVRLLGTRPNAARRCSRIADPMRRCGPGPDAPTP